THLARVRAGVTAAYPVGAIVIPPLVMDLSPANWSGFPWSAVGAQANIVLPMGYWSYRTDCPTDPSHCPYGHTYGNVTEARTITPRAAPPPWNRPAFRGRTRNSAA